MTKQSSNLLGGCRDDSRQERGVSLGHHVRTEVEAGRVASGQAVRNLHARHTTKRSASLCVNQSQRTVRGLLAARSTALTAASRVNSTGSTVTASAFLNRHKHSESQNNAKWSSERPVREFGNSSDSRGDQRQARSQSLQHRATQPLPCCRQ